MLHCKFRVIQFLKKILQLLTFVLLLFNREGIHGISLIFTIHNERSCNSS